MSSIKDDEQNSASVGSGGGGIGSFVVWFIRMMSSTKDDEQNSARASAGSGGGGKSMGGGGGAGGGEEKAIAASTRARDAGATFAVRIRGATGDKDWKVNGLYLVTDEVSGGMPLYKKQGAERWLEYHVSEGCWMSRSTDNKGQELEHCNAYVICDVGVLPDKAPRGAWRVIVTVEDEADFEAQASVLVTPMSAAEVAAEAAALQAACAAARAAATYAVRIGGATGDNACYVNGVYKVTDKVSGGMPVYRKQGGKVWLEYHVSQCRWMSRPTSSKGQVKNFCYAYVDCDVGVLPDKAPRGAWHVDVDNDAYEVQASVVVTPMSAEEVPAEAAVLRAARAAATYVVCIRGARGDKAWCVNGLYEVMDEVSGGMPVYKKQGAEMWLEYHVSRGQWMSRPTEHKGKASNSCWAYVDCDFGMLPDKAPRGAWHVYVNNAFEAQASVVVTPMSEEEVEILQAAFTAARAVARAAAAAAKVRNSED